MLVMNYYYYSADDGAYVHVDSSGGRVTVSNGSVDRLVQHGREASDGFVAAENE